MKFLEDSSFTVGDLTDVPFIYQGAKKYAMITSDVIRTKKSFQSIFPKLDTIQSPNDRVIFEARASADGNKWTEWLEANKNNKNEIDFYEELNYLQYHVTIISATDNSPIIKGVVIKLKGISALEAQTYKQKKWDDGITVSKPKGKPQPSLSENLSATAVSNPFVAGNLATREGLLGKTTANGHVIQATDIFVALPSRKSLNSSDTDTTYTVNVSYNGNTYYNVPVWDLGPFNENDDHWNPNYVWVTPSIEMRVRDNWGYEEYGDLTRGTSETWFAKYQNFHNGWTSSHRIVSKDKYISDSNPGTQVHNTLANPLYPGNSLRNNGAEIDLSDALFYGLGMTGNAYVTVTYNWVNN